MEDYGEEGSGYSVPYTATGNTTYPWQATWAGGTVTRTATTVDVPATNNQTVAKWTNKVAGSPSMDQTIASAQPLFRDLGVGIDLFHLTVTLCSLVKLLRVVGEVLGLITLFQLR